MKKINLSITGCFGRMGQQLVRSSKSAKNFKLVSVTEISLKFFTFFEDLMSCCPILPKQPVIDNFIFFIFL